MTTKAERFIKTHEKIKARKITSILKGQKTRFVEFLNKLNTKTALIEIKSIESNINNFVEEVAPEIPNYLLSVLPAIIKEGGKDSIKKYKKQLPKGYNFAFDVETSPASKYLKDLEDLMLSQREGSISKTTKEKLIGIMEQGVADGKSYGQIAKEIESADPWVFSKTRAQLIAINEVGRAYGWANHEPAVELQRQGYIMEKEWTTSHDEKVRPNHTANEAAGLIPLDQAFPGTGDQFAPSINEIRCRCTSTHQIAGIKKDGKIFILPKYIDAFLKTHDNINVWHTPDL